MKRAAKKKRSDTVATAVRLPREMLERLRQSEFGITDGIKRGVEELFAAERRDWMTHDLITEIAELAYEVKLETGAIWHRHAGAHEIFRLIIEKRLARLKPKGPTDFGERPRSRWINSDDPDVIATTFEHTNFSMYMRRLREEAIHKEFLATQEQGDKS